MKNLIFVFLTLFLAQNQNFATNPDTLDFTVVAPSGLSLRTAPYLDSDRLDVLPYGTSVKTIGLWNEIYQLDLLDTIDSRVGYWIPTEHQGQEGYLFSGYLKSGPLYVPPTDINNSFRITVPGERCQAINYDPLLNWYGIYIDPQDGSSKVKAVDIEIRQSSFSEDDLEIAYADIGDFLQVSAKQRDSFLLFFGTPNPINVDDIAFEKSYFENDDTTHWDPQGKFIYPYERLQIAEIDYDHYFLTGFEQLNEEQDEFTGETFSRKYGVYLSGHVESINLTEENSCDLSKELGTDQLFQYEYATYLGPRLVWQGDINNDGFPDVLFYTPYMAECCGGSISYQLLVSKKVNGKWILEKVAEDEVFSCYGC